MRQLGELEAVIMDRLWEWGRPALVREVVDDLHAERPLAYTTVMTVMENLHRKGWLRRGRGGRAGRYEPPRSPAGDTPAPINEALTTSSDPRTALAPFVLQMSPPDAPLLREAAPPAGPPWPNSASSWQALSWPARCSPPSPTCAPPGAKRSGTHKPPGWPGILSRPWAP